MDELGKQLMEITEEDCGLAWAVMQALDTGLYHVIPLNDTELHELYDHCKCNPEHNGETGEVVHNSFDGREEFQNEERKFS